MKRKTKTFDRRTNEPRTPPDPPSVHNWRTTDEEEIDRRRWRARKESFHIVNMRAEFPIFSNFQVRSGSGMQYVVEIRDLAGRAFSCECVDFRVNGLGTCKHVEAVLYRLQARFPRLYARAEKDGSNRIDIVPDLDRHSLRVERGLDRLPPSVRRLFDNEGRLRGDDPEEAVTRLRAARVSALRISSGVDTWLNALRRMEERKRLRREYEQKVQAGEFPANETKIPLFPYQREGMLHLAFSERALLADEMGLGKTVQAIAACALLHRMGKVRRVLVVTPASLKMEWEEQIARFTDLPYRLVFGRRAVRLEAYAGAPFFTLVNYEQMLADAMDVNALLKPDVVVLDEAQRIKNWSAKTTQSIKRLKSRYAFVLTGTPLENRIDEIRSLVDFLDPALLGPLFRFNRDFYELDDRGRPSGYRNLEDLRGRIRPIMLRRLKADVETELPARTDRNYFVSLNPAQRAAYADHEAIVGRLVSIAKRRPLIQQEQDKLMRELAMMRMICDTNYILDDADTACPKLDELEKILDEVCSGTDVKLVVFSEWERMLMLTRKRCEKMKLGYAWHTGSVPQKRRRAEIMTFKNDPACRVFLSTDSGGVGLNLQCASVVVNCDLPWNPARLEQRIARAWRKHQTRNVTVINLVSENTIEHRMIGTLEAKRGLAEGILDGQGDLSKVSFRGGAQAFMTRLKQMMTAPPKTEEPLATPPLPTDRSAAFAARARETLGAALSACEERFPMSGSHSVLLVVVDRDAAVWKKKLETLYLELFGPGQSDPLAPVHLQVVDRSAFEALKQFEECGLIAGATRATRSLYPAEEIVVAALSEDEKRALEETRNVARRKLKAARLLLAEELAEEASRPLRDTIRCLGRAYAMRNRLPLPETPEEALAPHLLAGWGDLAAPLQSILAGSSPLSQPLIERLDRLAACPFAE